MQPSLIITLYVIVIELACIQAFSDLVFHMPYVHGIMYLNCDTNETLCSNYVSSFIKNHLFYSSTEMGVKGLQQFVDLFSPGVCVPVNLRKMAQQHQSKSQHVPTSTAKSS